MNRTISIVALLLATMMASFPVLAAPRLDFVELAATPPPTDDFAAACAKRRSAEICVCMTHRLVATGAGQAAIAIDDLGRRYPHEIPDADFAALLARHGLLPEQRKALVKLTEETVRETIGACR